MLRNFGKSRSQVNGFHVGRLKLIYKLGPMAGCGVSRGVGLWVGGCRGGRLINHEVSTRDVCHIRLHLEPRPQICMLFHDIVLRQLNSAALVAVLCGTLYARKYIPTTVLICSSITFCYGIYLKDFNRS